MRAAASSRSRHRVPFHALRSGALALAVLSLAAGAHVIAGGTLPAFPVLLALLALTALATTLATRFKLGLPAVAALLGGGQVLLHEAFTALGPVAAGPVAEAPHVHHAVQLPVIGDAAQHLHGLDTSLGWFMLAAHVLATAASALLFAKGEQALWQLASWLRPLWRVLALLFVPDAGTRRARAGAPSAFTPRPWRNLRQDSRRGPPAVVVPS
ncbi:hypothetical protein [Arthrobacter celericrescens]|uniref:hypothetical protein n=1 Tax=Arthrobacter celericrescens TaxID=2320851 RepID=UPI000EA15FA4|nr:hypothetical protein [Arthrobacter celericrescens]